MRTGFLPVGWLAIEGIKGTPESDCELAHGVRYLRSGVRGSAPSFRPAASRTSTLADKGDSSSEHVVIRWNELENLSSKRLRNTHNHSVSFGLSGSYMYSYGLQQCVIVRDRTASQCEKGV
jgi:hypothetical protein